MVGSPLLSAPPTVIIVFLRLRVPLTELAPIVIAVAAPPIFKPVATLLNTFAVPTVVVVRVAGPLLIETEPVVFITEAFK